jgi:hypothetical protein
MRGVREYRQESSVDRTIGEAISRRFGAKII